MYSTFQGLTYPQTPLMQFQTVQQQPAQPHFLSPQFQTVQPQFVQPQFHSPQFYLNSCPAPAVTYTFDMMTGLYVPTTNTFTPQLFQAPAKPVYSQPLVAQTLVYTPPLYTSGGSAHTTPNTSPCLRGMSPPCSLSSFSSDSQVENCETLSVTRVVPSQKTSLEQFASLYRIELAKALSNVLGNILHKGELSVDFAEKRKRKKSSSEFEIRWNYTTACPATFQRVSNLVNQKDFEDSLTCEMATIQDGSFNKYLDGAKQLTIIHMGYLAVQRLNYRLTNPNGELPKILATPFEERFGESCRDLLYKVCDDQKGNALRGKFVIGIRFKRATMIASLDAFLQNVLAKVQVDRATMIASLKKNNQYKGWSLYLDVHNQAGTDAVMQIAESFGFTLRPKQCFIAEE